MSDREEVHAIADLITTLARLDLEPEGRMRDVFNYTKTHAPKCIEERSRYESMYYSLLREGFEFWMLA